jgi:hypothetical protein
MVHTQTGEKTSARQGERASERDRDSSIKATRNQLAVCGNAQFEKLISIRVTPSDNPMIAFNHAHFPVVEAGFT